MKSAIGKASNGAAGREQGEDNPHRCGITEGGNHGRDRNVDGADHKAGCQNGQEQRNESRLREQGRSAGCVPA